MPEQDGIAFAERVRQELDLDDVSLVLHTPNPRTRLPDVICVTLARPQQVET